MIVIGTLKLSVKAVYSTHSYLCALSKLVALFAHCTFSVTQSHDAPGQDPSLPISIADVKIFKKPQEQNCAALLAFVSMLWCTEALPLFITSTLIPLLAGGSALLCFVFLGAMSHTTGLLVLALCHIR